MPATRKRNLYSPDSEKPYRISRSKIDLFMKCPRCFYLDRKLGIGQPSGPPFTLNSAVDALLKKEFDSFREQGKPHPLMSSNGIDAIPFKHADIEVWRDSLRRGITYLDAASNLLITGGVDDVWVRPDGELIIVDYKATAKAAEVNLDSDWQISYKRQMEIYQWLFRKNKFRVSDVGYFVYCNGNLAAESFSGQLSFSIKVIPYQGNGKWIEGVITKMHATLISANIPAASNTCEFCAYRAAAALAEAPS